MASSSKRRGAGRPRGAVNKATAEVKALARKHSDAAFKKIISLLESIDERVALAAAQDIPNRAYGKPRHELSIEADGEIIHRVVFAPRFNRGKRGSSAGASCWAPLLQARSMS